jgi:hypothetical protein
MSAKAHPLILFWNNECMKTKQKFHVRAGVSCIFLFAILFVVMFESCEEKEPQRFEIKDVTIDATGYTGSTPKFLFSTGDISYSETLPKVKPGAKIRVHIYNDQEQLSGTDFRFDWSLSTPAPVSTIGAFAEFTATSDLQIHVTISDVMELITHRDDGTFLNINKIYGWADRVFVVRYNSEPLYSIQAFAYHPKQQRYYASVTGNNTANGIVGGYLYTIDPITNIATRINENNGTSGIQWTDIDSWAVGEDDSLVAIGDFGDRGTGIGKFGKDGGPSLTVRNIDICCGGIVLDQKTKQILAANGVNSGPGEVDIENISANGTILNSTTISTFLNFPRNMADGISIPTGLAKDEEGILYGVIRTTFPPLLQTREYYFVKINLHSPSIEYISTLDGAFEMTYHNYYGLAWIPRHVLN